MIQGSPCPVCGKERAYSTKSNARKGEGKPCLSCANSIKMGGEGWSEFCIDCKTNPRDEKYNSLCKGCHNNRSRNYYKTTYRWSKYGLSGPIDMDACEICDEKDDLVIDHCHDTGKFRGVLCRNCNLGIGSLKENKDVIRKALKYAERTFNGT